MVVETDVPARLDRLPWCRFHTLVLFALGITWVLDGLEVNLAGALSGALEASPALHLSDRDVGLAASVYLAGAVTGALLFGWLTDRLGRKRLFMVTLGVYLVGTALSAFAFNFGSYALFRFITGAGIGGEYTAMNSAIQELIPARYRGRTDLIINGSWWIGTILGAIAALVLLNPRWFPGDVGWRLAFGIGAALGLVVLQLRRYLPESPRWLMIHGRVAEAERVVAEIEARTAVRLDAPAARIRLRARERSGMLDVARSLFRLYPQRALLGLVLMAAQAFFYNAIFFTYALVLGRFFDSIGRRVMITLTYAASGVLLLLTAALFKAGLFDAVTQTLAWSVVFFFASAAASSAYLTVSESFPLEVRALAIAIFFALGTGLGGVAGPWLFGILIGTGEPGAIAWGYALGAVLMLIAAAVEWRIGIGAERRALEEVAAPLSAAAD